MATRVITIYARTAGDFDVHEGECYATRLCWDEMLGQVASMTHPAIKHPRYRMESPDTTLARMAHYRESRERREAQIVVDERDALQRLVNEWGRRAGPADTLLPANQQSPLIRAAMEALATTTTPEIA